MTQTLIWVAIVGAVAVIIWLAEPYHTRLIDAAHKRDQAAREEQRTK